MRYYTISREVCQVLPAKPPSSVIPSTPLATPNMGHRGCRPRFLRSRTPPEEDPAALGPALAPFGRTAASAVADKAGALALAFGDGSRVLVPPNSDYETWEVSGPAGLLLVSLPGGGVAVWTADDEAAA